MYTAIERNKRNTIILIVLFIAVVVGVAFYVGYLVEIPELPWIALSFVGVYTVFQYIMAAQEAVKLVGGVKITRDFDPELWRLVNNLAVREGLPMPELYIIDDESPNAMAAGTSPNNAVIGVTSGLLELLDKSELEAVLAHEFGHIKNYDIRVKTIIFGLIGAVAAIAIAGWFLALMGMQGIASKTKGVAFFGAMFAVIGVFMGASASAVSHVVGPVLRSAISKQREYLADASAVETTRFPDGLVRALTKIKNYDQPMALRSSATAHLYFSNPLRSRLSQFLVGSHPPIEKRIERLKKISGSF